MEYAHAKRLAMIYAQLRVLHDIANNEWQCPSDLKAALYKRGPPPTLIHTSNDFLKCFVGCTNTKPLHSRRFDYRDVLRVLRAPEERIKAIAQRRREWIKRKLKGGRFSLEWNNGSCFVLRACAPDSFMQLPLKSHVFFPDHFPKQSATPAQMYQASRIIASNERLYCTPIYAAIVDCLAYLMRVTKFADDPFQDGVRPLFIRPAYATMVDYSPKHGYSLFATVTQRVLDATPPGTPVVSEGSALAVVGGTIRPSYPEGEHYAFNYINYQDGPWAQLRQKSSNLVTTTEARFGGGERVDTGGPAFYANCSHDGNCYVYTVDIQYKGSPVIEGSSSLYKMPVLTASRDLYPSDFVEGEGVAVKAGYGPVSNVYRLALEYRYSNAHVVQGRPRQRESYIKCTCLSQCFGRRSDWYFYHEDKPRAASKVKHDLKSLERLRIPANYFSSIKRWLNHKRERLERAPPPRPREKSSRKTERYVASPCALPLR